MKKISAILALISLFTMGCHKDNTNPFATDGFSITLRDTLLVQYNDIEYYDSSSHLIYLKKNVSYAEYLAGTFKVYVDGVEIYSGFHGIFPGLAPRGPNLTINEYTINLDFASYIDSLGNNVPDPRSDPRIIESFKKFNQFYEGLSCKIDTIIFSSSNHVTMELDLANNDAINYYYLDPDKMGNNLYHYFTNGLTTWDFTNNKCFYFYNIDSVERPVPWNKWEKDWLSLIKGKEHKKISISYSDFEPLAPGEYNMSFSFPGLHPYQIDKSDFEQENGRIWLGNLSAEKEITIE